MLGRRRLSREEGLADGPRVVVCGDSSRLEAFVTALLDVEAVVVERVRPRQADAVALIKGLAPAAVIVERKRETEALLRALVREDVLVLGFDPVDGVITVLRSRTPATVDARERHGVLTWTKRDSDGV